MSCGSVLPASQVSLSAMSGLTAYHWTTAWAPCTGLSSFDATLKAKAVSGSFRCQVVVQYAAVRADDPDAPSSVGSALTGAGESLTSSGDISGTTSTKMWRRYGIKYDLTAGSAATADVELQVAENSCGQVLATWSGVLVASSTTRAYQEIGMWVPAILAQKIKAAIVVNSLSGNFQWRLTYRTATTSKESPSAWTSDWDTTNNPDRTAGEVNTGELSPSLSGKMWVQIGIQYNLSGATAGQAFFSVLLTAHK